MGANRQEDKIGFSDEEEGMNREMRRIARWLKQVRFRKRLFGGVSERDVWKNIGELNDMYHAALTAERARYDTLLEQRSGAGAEGEDGCEQANSAGGERR